MAEGKSDFRQGFRDPEAGGGPASLLPTWIRDNLPLRSMDPLARGISLTELWNCILPGTTLGDRGVILERDWGVIPYPFVDLRELEAQGKVPSMIFSPMLVEDGRRLLISNLDLSIGKDGWLSSPIVEDACQQISQDEPISSASKDGGIGRRAKGCWAGTGWFRDPRPTLGAEPTTFDLSMEAASCDDIQCEHQKALLTTRRLK